ncbi:hypothetical protein BDR03DRAFT_980850 [Suillus americanus]|nr:hypothetical protein BDR03DRAFT_980850 [Suillus americanus]
MQPIFSSSDVDCDLNTQKPERFLLPTVITYVVQTGYESSAQAPPLSKLFTQSCYQNTRAVKARNDFGLRAQKALKRLKGTRWVCSEAQNGDEAPEECYDVQKIPKNAVDLVLSPDTVYASGSREDTEANK